MAKPSIFSKYNYLLTKIFFSLSVLVFIFTFVLVAAHYQKHANLHQLGYEQMLTTLETTYLYEMIEENERQLSVLISLLDKEKIERGEPAFNSTWPVVHKIKMESDHYIFFYNHQSDLIETYPHWERPEHFLSEKRPWYRLIKNPSHDSVWVGPYMEYNTQQLVLSLGQTVFSEEGHVLGMMLVDMSLEMLNKTLKRMVGDLDVSLFLRQRGSGTMLSVVNEQLLQLEQVSRKNAFFHLNAFTQGALLTKSLPYVNWELGIYIPPHRFRAAFFNELVLLILPITAITLMMILGICSLLKIFRQELRLLEQRVRQFDPKKHPSQMQTSAWFVDRSLTTIEQQHQTHLLKLRLDPLTGILNRRAFDEDLYHYAEMKQSYTVILIDVDLFKQINDSFGHPFGDFVLQQVSIVLTEIFGTESVYRIGGDEFACLLPSSQQETLAQQLDQLIININQHTWPEKTCHVSVSVGATIGDGPSVQLFKQADMALYQSKHAGRNCWHLL